MPKGEYAKWRVRTVAKEDHLRQGQDGRLTGRADMSAWSVGAVPKAAIHAEDATGPTGLKTFVDKVVAWIPGDVLGLYLAAVAAVGVAKPQLWLLIVAVLLAPAVVLLGAQT